MGKRGPAPRPAEVVQLYGDNSGRKPPNQPPRVGTVPKAPMYLSATALEFWEQTVPLLEQMFVLGASDFAALEQASVLYSRWRVAVDDADDRMMKQLSGQLLPYLSKLGMTPADRLRMVVPPKEEPKRSHVLD